MMRIPRSATHAFATSCVCTLTIFQPVFVCGCNAPATDLGDESASRAEGAPAAPEGRDALGADTSDTELAYHHSDKFDWIAGDYPPELHEPSYLEITGVPGQPGKTRQYKVHVPRSYRSEVSAPVLFAFHGYTQDAQFVVNSTTFLAKSEQEGFILVMPNGLQEDWLGGSWNAGTCCGEAAAQKLDDVALVRAIYAQLRKHLNVDTSRVYATGFSNGGYMSHRLGCEAADIFVAIAPMAGAIGTAELGPWVLDDPEPDLERCEPTQPVAVLAMHGDADEIVFYAGMPASLAHWAVVDGCTTTTTPATVPASGGDTTCITYVGCPERVEVTGCTVKDGGHCWFGDPACGTGVSGLGNLIVGNNSNFLSGSDAAWAFLKRFRR